MVTLEQVTKANTYNVGIKFSQTKKGKDDSKLMLLLRQYYYGYAAQIDLYCHLIDIGKIKYTN